MGGEIFFFVRIRGDEDKGDSPELRCQRASPPRTPHGACDSRNAAPGIYGIARVIGYLTPLNELPSRFDFPYNGEKLRAMRVCDGRQQFNEHYYVEENRP